MQRESQERRHRETRQGGKRQKISHGCSTRPHGACARLQQPRRGPGLYNGQPPTPHPQPHSTTLILLTVPCAVALGTWPECHLHLVLRLPEESRDSRPSRHRLPGGGAVLPSLRPAGRLPLVGAACEGVGAGVAPQPYRAKVPAGQTQRVRENSPQDSWGSAAQQGAKSRVCHLAAVCARQDIT